ncbi:MAG: hypothetical protein JW768_15435 [Chitinispirillaceae bacterium]|nr:hypothetical protein [Chitinispirillaceae bacterium]
MSRYRPGLTVCAGLLMVGALCTSGICCGGGYIPLPYVPTASGNITTSSSHGSFYLIEKGSANDLFDVKKLQPLFHHIHTSGNKRKSAGKMKKARKTGPAGTVANSTDSSIVAHDDSNEAKPVLNLHSIH